MRRTWILRVFAVVVAPIFFGVSLSVHAQPVPVPDGGAPRSPGVAIAAGGACGVHAVGDSSFVPISVKAVASSPFSVEISFAGPAGTYHLQSTGLEATVLIAPPSHPIAAPTLGGIALKNPTGTFTHKPTLPGTRYDYVVQADLGGGKKACGISTATTLRAPPVSNIGGQYIDASNVGLGFLLPPFVHEAHLYRGNAANPASEAWSLVIPGRNVAGEQGQMIPSITVDPGPPPFPYDNAGTYIRTPASYSFLIEVVWTGNPDGSGNRVSATYPVSVHGPASITGYADLHSHQMAYLGFGGNPQNYPRGRYFFGKAFGPIDTALPWCTPVCGPGGVNDLADYIMRTTTYHMLPANTGHAVGGFPAFDGYPRWNRFTGQQYYESWLKRAHLGGLKLIVVHPVYNAWMCTTLNHTSVAELAAILAGAGFAVIGAPAGGAAAIATGLTPAAIFGPLILAYQYARDPDCLDDAQAINQINEVWAMQNDIDQRVGDGHGNFGPGTGWYRVVKSPGEARSVIASGKLAVVIGMEVDNPFDCTHDNSGCNNGGWKDRLDAYYQSGVRHFFPLHFYNNAFGGSANSNPLISQSFTNDFQKRDCSTEGYEYDNRQCNADGLYPEGKSLVGELMKRGMIIDVDHMSANAFNDTLDIVSENNKRYPVVSSHTGFTGISSAEENNEGNRTDSQIARMLSVGGMFAVIPHQGMRDQIHQFPFGSNIRHICGNSSQTVAQAYRYAIEKSGNGPIGIGSDLNGFAGWPSPRFGPDECMGDKPQDYDSAPGPALLYPYTITATGLSISSQSLDPGPSLTTAGVQLQNIDGVGHAVVGQRVFDFNTDGFAHIGLLPDMIADWQAMGMQPVELDPLFFSAEGYIRLWERTTYIASHPN